jgi:hypothetical protein
MLPFPGRNRDRLRAFWAETSHSVENADQILTHRCFRLISSFHVRTGGRNLANSQRTRVDARGNILGKSVTGPGLHLIPTEIEEHPVQSLNNGGHILIGKVSGGPTHEDAPWVMVIVSKTSDDSRGRRKKQILKSRNITTEDGPSRSTLC